MEGYLSHALVADASPQSLVGVVGSASYPPAAAGPVNSLTKYISEQRSNKRSPVTAI